VQPTQLIPEALVEAALHAIAHDRGSLADALNELPAAIYVTDRDGVITHFNDACIKLAGRTPVPLEDRWCVTWKLYHTSGEFMPHDRCPMAVAVQERRAVRGLEAIAERPDGSRVNFVPHPTPYFDEDGQLAGAVNLLLDVTDLRRAANLRDEAARCRRLARSMGDQQTAETLARMAEEYEAEAARIAGLN
jgi:PAS domain S-box-containing protein